MEKQGIKIEWTPWKMPEDANPPAKPEGYKEQAQTSLQKLKSKVGLEIVPLTQKPDSYLAHVGAKFAKSKGVFDRFHLQVFEALWKHDRNIGDVEVLKSIAQEAGLDPGELKEALNSDRYRGEVDTDFERAAQQKIWTIPAYIGEKGEIQVHHFKDLPSIEELKRIW